MSRRSAHLPAAALALFVTGFLVAVATWQFFGGGVWRSEANIVEASRRLYLVIIVAMALSLVGFLGVATRRLAFLIVAAVALPIAGFIAAVLAWDFFGGGVWRSEVRVFEMELHSPTRLVLGVGSCNGNPEVTGLRETDVDVQVEVIASSTPLRGGDDCMDRIEVQLQEPLAGRTVIDEHTGQSVSVRTAN